MKYVGYCIPFQFFLSTELTSIDRGYFDSDSSEIWAGTSQTKFSQPEIGWMKMKEWINNLIREWMRYEWINEMNEWMNEWMNDRMNEWMIEWMKNWMN